MTATTIEIQIVADLVCPWCFVGKRRLERAIEQFKATSSKQVDFSVTWRPYQLLPNAPKQSIEKSVSYAQRFGADRAKQMISGMVQIGKGEGIAFNYAGKIGNTFDAHRLIAYAKRFNLQNEVVEQLLHAYFEKTQDIADNAVLVSIAGKAGLDQAKVQAYLDSEEGNDQVKEQLNRNKKDNISGVPSFFIQGRFYFSGAQSPESFVSIFNDITSQQ
ncbi:hypothetical protein DSO57_1020516 [Entomophthora muscae]|uniref:Uncharacterized protein n=2 Tax=Entomophthora muscae TaxID=34485 RepID=A0ACC2RIF4_9FUNG|nr:hypothetical protein DSO57_1020515 [Entomophthora muscae]KAJ9049840.1 hypothetical protein DSO57_1020516 [Entomophthora muscae]